MSNKIKALLMTTLIVFSHFALLGLLISGLYNYPTIGVVLIFSLVGGVVVYSIYKNILEGLER